jgi:hypothetical protein
MHMHDNTMPEEEGREKGADQIKREAMPRRYESLEPHTKPVLVSSDKRLFI